MGTQTTATVGSDDGFYSFTDLIPGDYYLEFVAPAGYAITLPDQGGSDLATAMPIGRPALP